MFVEIGEATTLKTNRQTWFNVGMNGYENYKGWTISNTSLSCLLSLASPLLSTPASLNSSMWISIHNTMTASYTYLVGRNVQPGRAEGLPQIIQSRRQCIPAVPFQSLSGKSKRHCITSENTGQNWAPDAHCGDQFDYACLYWLFLLSCSTLFNPSLQLPGFTSSTEVHGSGSSSGENPS